MTLRETLYVIALSVLMLGMCVFNALAALQLFGLTWPFYFLAGTQVVMLLVFNSQWRKWLSRRDDYYY